MNDPLTLTISDGTEQDSKIYALTGPLTISTLFSFQSAIRAETARSVVIDLTGVPYVDSAGLGSLVLAHVSFSKTGRHIALAGVNDRVRALLQMTRVETLFPIVPSVSAAQKTNG